MYPAIRLTMRFSHCAGLTFKDLGWHNLCVFIWLEVHQHLPMLIFKSITVRSQSVNGGFIMSEIFERLHSVGFSECFYQDGKLWGFYRDDVIPKPIPKEIIQSVDIHSPRQQLGAKFQRWCDRRGMRRVGQCLSR